MLPLFVKRATTLETALGKIRIPAAWNVDAGFSTLNQVVNEAATAMSMVPAQPTVPPV